jgi:hypothetical protein
VDGGMIDAAIDSGVDAAADAPPAVDSAAIEVQIDGGGLDGNLD